MSTEPLLFFVGNRDPSIRQVLTKAGAAFDGTGKTVRFKMRAFGSTALKVDQPAAWDDQAGGIAVYDWAAADVDTAGWYVCWWGITTTATGKTEDMNEAPLEFRAHGSTTGNLCELEDVRLQMGTDSGDRSRDARIRDLIPAASVEVVNYCQRELFPAAAATRDLPLRSDRDDRGRIVIDLAPYDLRVVTTMTLDPGGLGEDVLVEGTDYQLAPVGKDEWGVYTEVVLANSLALPADVTAFGEGILRILGDWGMTSVPEKAKQACIVTVRSWISREGQQGAFTNPEGRAQTPAPAKTFTLPPAAKSLLKNLRRIPLG